MNDNPPTPDLAPLFPDKTPRWKISPAGGKYFINSVAVSADGGRVVGGTFYHHYGSVAARRAPASPNQPPSGNPSPDDGTFGVYCYNADGQLQWKDEFQGWQGVYWVALSADGTRAAAGGFMSSQTPQGFIRAYDAGNQGRLMLSQATQQRVNQVALSGDGQWLVSAAETLRLFQHDTATHTYRPTDEFMPNHTLGIVSAAISTDGLTVVAADFAGWIRVFANNGGKFQQRAAWKVPGQKSTDFCHMVDLAPDGKCFAAGGANGLFYFFDVAGFIATGQPTCHYNTGIAGAVYGVAVAETGGLFAGVVNVADAGRSYLVKLAGQAPVQVMLATLVRNPNSAAINATHGLFAVADGHPDGTPGHFYLFGNSPSGGLMPSLRWIYQTGNMSWPITIAANGSAVVAGSDDSYIYYFSP